MHCTARIPVTLAIKLQIQLYGSWESPEDCSEQAIPKPPTHSYPM